MSHIIAPNCHSSKYISNFSLSILGSMGAGGNELEQTKYRTTVAGEAAFGSDDMGQLLILCDGEWRSKAEIIQCLSYNDYPDVDGNMVQLGAEVTAQFAGMINNLDGLINQAVGMGYLEVA